MFYVARLLLNSNTKLKIRCPHFPHFIVIHFSSQRKSADFHFFPYVRPDGARRASSVVNRRGHDEVSVLSEAKLTSELKRKQTIIKRKNERANKQTNKQTNNQTNKCAQFFYRAHIPQCEYNLNDRPTDS